MHSFSSRLWAATGFAAASAQTRHRETGTAPLHGHQAPLEVGVLPLQWSDQKRLIQRPK